MPVNEFAFSIKKAIELAQTGKKLKARQLLKEIIQNDHKNLQAWYVLSFVVDEREKKIDCLQRVLKYAPDHNSAQLRLQKLRTIAVPPTTSVQAVDPATTVQVETNSSKKHFEPSTDKNHNHFNTTSASTTLITTKVNKEPYPKQQESTRHSKWFGEIDSAQDFQKEYNGPDILQILFDDIARLPIITNLHQELWLGVQLQASSQLAAISENWKSSAYSDTSTFTQFLCQTLLFTWTSLEEQCLEHEIPTAKLELWASELLKARRDVYTLRRSRIRRFIRRVQAISEKDVTEKLLRLVYQAVETLAIFPRNMLTQIISFVNTHKGLPSAEEMASWFPATLDDLEQQVQARKIQTEQILITGYLRYAMRVAQGYMGQGIDYTDLVQAGFIGLSRAARKFDYRIQARFGSYATSWIWQAVGREIADQSRTVRLPVHVQESLRKWQTACDHFDDGYSEPISNPHILFHAGLFAQEDYDKLQKLERDNRPLPKKLAARYENAMLKARKLCSSFVPVVPMQEIFAANQTQNVFEEFNEIESVVELVPDENLHVETGIDIPFVRQLIEEQIFSFLTDREREVLELRCGWQDNQQRTLEEIGELYNLTRERIRQIEARAYKKLEARRGLDLLPNPYELLPDEKPTLSWYSGVQMVLPSLELTNSKDLAISERVGDLLSQLPRSDWIQGRSGVQGGQRQEQLTVALEQIGIPAHVTDISEQLNDVIEDKELDDSNVYALLVRDEETFVLLGQGIFSLVKWERERVKEKQPTLPCCPIPLPDPPDYEEAFFESVLIGQQVLKKGLTAEEFVHQMLNWAKTESEPQNWFLQTILSAYYLIDLIPYVFYFGGDNPVLSCTLPTASIQELRYHCLKSVTERLMAMPEFWWLLQQRQPVRPTDLGELFADVHPYGLDDVLQRLRLLASLGAVQKLKYGEYRLTTLGEECANQWKQRVVETTVDTDVNGSDVEDNFTNFIAWW